VTIESLDNLDRKSEGKQILEALYQPDHTPKKKIFLTRTLI